MSQQFFDHFAEANMSLQERLGRSRVTLNRDSAVLGTQTRSLLQMLNYGLDAITARAATHLLNFAPLHANTAYLMKLCEGLLLNTIESITPPHLTYGKPLTFRSVQAYEKYKVVGTCALLDGTPCNLIVYRDPEPKQCDLPEMNQYEVYYCAGAYVHQSVAISSLDFTPGTVQSVYVSEQYKSIWADSVEITVVRDNGESPIKLEPYWSFDALLSAADASNAVLVQHTPRGLTITLGDGEVFGQGYNKRQDVGAAPLLEIAVSYIKCESLADVDHASVTFNEDVVVVGDIPLLTKPKPGDTAESMRTRALAEFFAAGKITCERDMETELRKIAIVKSAHCEREYNYPFGKFQGSIDSLKQSIPEWTDTKSYKAGDMVRASGTRGDEYVYFCVGEPAPATRPSGSELWFPVFPIESSYVNAMHQFYRGYPTYQVYDNATLIVTGLVLRSRHYYREDKAYSVGDTVYYAKTNQVYKAVTETYGVAPDDDPVTGVTFPWQSAEEAVSDPDFDAYEEITPAIFELELKHYFGIWQKLGFISVVVEPLVPIKCQVTCSYSSPYPLDKELQDVIASAICWEVGTTASAEVLNSKLTDMLNLAAVNVDIAYYNWAGGTKLASVAYNQYVRRSALTITLKEI